MKTYEREMHQGDSIYEMVIPRDREDFDRDFQRALNGELVRTEKSFKVGAVELCYEFHYAPVRIDGERVSGVFLGIMDITERKQAEAELRRAKDELETAHRELQQSFVREQQLAHTDALTDINNHHFLLQLAEREFEVAMRYRPPLSVMFFDIDDFKQINDNFGHLMGDQALKKLIQVVRAEIRSADVIGRYGGDEFVILLPQTSAEEALPFAERIHASVAAIRLETDKGALTLKISIGIAQTIHQPVSEPGHGAQNDTVENLLLRADQALYAAKQAGKNCTVIF